MLTHMCGHDPGPAAPGPAQGGSGCTSFLMRSLGALESLLPLPTLLCVFPAGDSAGDDGIEAFWNRPFLWPPLALPRSPVGSVLCRQSRGDAER